MSLRMPKKIFLFFIFGSSIFFIGRYFGQNSLNGSYMISRNARQFQNSSNNKLYFYDREMPIIFIGGMPRSGTTLMRAMLDAHTDIRCGEETRVIPRILGMKYQWFKSEKESNRLIEGGMTENILLDAVAAFILEIIAKHGEPAPRLCNKDPFALKYINDLLRMFPNSKFILMVRDGRAVVHSIVTRGITISGFDIKNYKSCLEKWNSAVTNMFDQCTKVGASICKIVHYEQLVMHPKKMMEEILKFVDVSWDGRVLHHEDFINQPGGVSLSKTEKSTDQVVRPVNLEALTKWTSSVPLDVKKNIRTIAPMLIQLGYDPDNYSPKYGEPDSIVLNNTHNVIENQNGWNVKADAAQSHSKISKKAEILNHTDLNKN